MTGPAADRRPLVVGLGNPDRGDDGVGVEVAARVAALDPSGVRVVTVADPTGLVHLLDGVDTVVVVDALRSGARPGTVRVLDTRCDPLPRGGTALGTHAFGLASTVELARALGRLPRRLVVVGVEAGPYETGGPLSDAVAAAVDVTAHRVLAVCRWPTDTTSAEHTHV